MSGQASPAPPTGSARYAINLAIFELARHPDARTVVADKGKFFAGYPLRADERQALLDLDWKRLLVLGVLPNLLYRYYALHGFAPDSFAAAVAAAG